MILLSITDNSGGVAWTRSLRPGSAVIGANKPGRKERVQATGSQPMWLKINQLWRATFCIAITRNCL